jgi:hypothetical protein
VNRDRDFNSDFNSSREADFKPVINDILCVYTNADSLLNKRDELKARFMSDGRKPDIT